MNPVSIREMLECGVHFGHPTRRWNPKMKKYLFGERNGISIIDLQRSARHAKKAIEFVRDVSMEGGNVLFVGTKRQASDVVVEEANRCDSYYVNHRWLGGLLTNFVTIQGSIRRLKELEDLLDGDKALVGRSKKELARMDKERDRLDKVLHGIKDMRGLPAAVFVVDVMKEHIAVAEANKLNIPVIAIVDSNCDPDPIDFVIPGNDDAIRSIKYFSGKIADAVLEGQEIYKAKKAEEERQRQQERARVEKQRAAEAAKRKKEREEREKAAKAKKEEEAKARKAKEAKKDDSDKADDTRAAAPKTDKKRARATKKSDAAADKKADAKKADDKKAETKKADDKKAETKKADDKKAETKKADDKKAETKKADDKKAETKKADDTKKSDAGKKSDAKADDKKAEAKADDKKAEAKADTKADDASDKKAKDSSK